MQPAWAPARPPDAAPVPDFGAPVIDAASIAVGTKIDANRGTLLTLRPTVARAPNAESTALLEGGMFQVVNRTSRATFLQVLQDCAASGAQGAAAGSGGVSARATRYRRPPHRATFMDSDSRPASGFHGLTNHLLASPTGTKYVVTATCDTESVAVDAGIVNLKTKTGTRIHTMRLTSGRVAVVHTRPQSACQPSRRFGELRRISGSTVVSLRAQRALPKSVLDLLRGDVKGRFHTRGRYSAATVCG
jgi:hypothetical protein